MPRPGVFEREPLLLMDDDADIDHFNKTHNYIPLQLNNNTYDLPFTDSFEMHHLKYNQNSRLCM